jgi:hypothetical protein
MSSEIERFLLQAARRPKGRTLPGKPVSKPADVEIVEAEPVVGQGLDSEVADHVSKYLNTSQFSEKASQLGVRVGLADDIMDAHLHDRFDHRLGRLGAAAASVSAGSSGPLGSLGGQQGEAPGGASPLEVPPSVFVRLLQSPEDLRRAIVLSEILNRPEFRW